MRFISPRVKPRAGYAAYVKYVSFLMIRAPCLQTFYEAVICTYESLTSSYEKYCRLLVEGDSFRRNQVDLAGGHG